MKEVNGLGLHLPSLSVRNFRGIRDLSISRLGRVNLIAGRNGVGKTTILEAARIFARRGSLESLEKVLRRRKEILTVSDESNETYTVSDFAALFYGRATKAGDSVSIGPLSSSGSLKIKLTRQGDLTKKEREWLRGIGLGGIADLLRVSYGGHETMTAVSFIPGESYEHLPARLHPGYPAGFSFRDKDAPKRSLRCESLGPGLPSNDRIASYLDTVTLKGEKAPAIRSLRLMDDRVEDAFAVGDSGPEFRGRGRRIVVALSDDSTPVSLNSLGDGITRLFAAALAVACSRNGLLVIDEVENGIHYSVQQDFWRMIMNAAMNYNVQILATTQSFDCVRGFAMAAAEIGRYACTLVRIDRHGNQLKAIEYPPRDLEAAAVQCIEVR